MHDYWKKQSDKPLFPQIEWAKPEQRSAAGKLLIIGGNSHSFALPVAAHDTARKAGIGECRVVLPDSLKKVIDGQGADCLFVPSTKTGGMSKEALPAISSYALWTDGLLLIGDSGRNAETAIVHERLLAIDRPFVITRDALDLIRTQADQWLHRPNTCIVATFAQLQKIFQTAHYPKMLLFSMQLTQLVEALHKFTLSYPVQIITMHHNTLVVASDGEISTTPCEDNLALWRGKTAAYAATYQVHHPQKPFQALTAAVLQSTISTGQYGNFI